MSRMPSVIQYFQNQTCDIVTFFAHRLGLYFTFGLFVHNNSHKNMRIPSCAIFIVMNEKFFTIVLDTVTIFSQRNPFIMLYPSHPEWSRHVIKQY